MISPSEDDVILEIFFICFDFRAWALHTVIMNLAKFSEIFDKKKTFRPKKKFQPGTMKYSLHKQAQASLNSGINLRQVVKLPKGEDFNDWLAVHVVDFFNRINLIYGTVCEQVRS